MQTSPIIQPVEVLKRFQFICCLCYGEAVAVHEIEPRSRRPTDWWKWDNRAPLCAECHARVHEQGTRKWEQKLREGRQVLASLLLPGE